MIWSPDLESKEKSDIGILRRTRCAYTDISLDTCLHLLTVGTFDSLPSPRVYTGLLEVKPPRMLLCSALVSLSLYF